MTQPNLFTLDQIGSLFLILESKDDSFRDYDTYCQVNNLICDIFETDKPHVVGECGCAWCLLSSLRELLDSYEGPYSPQYVGNSADGFEIVAGERNADIEAALQLKVLP